MLTLPFRDRTRLARTAPLELLGQRPARSGRGRVSAQPLARTPGGTDVLAVAVRREDLATLRATLGEAGVVPARIELAPLPALQLVPPASGSVALVVADGARSAVVVRRDATVAGLRALGQDSNDPTALAAEAKWTLRALGFSGRTLVAGPDADAVQAALAAVLEGPVNVLAPPASLAAAGSAADVTACAVVVGLVAGAGRRTAGVVLAGGDAESPGHWRRAAALAAAALLLGIVDVGLVRTTLARREAALAKAVTEVAAAALPGTPVSAARAQLEEAVAARRRLRPAGDVPVLEVLRELSTRVPASLHLDLDELVIEPDVVRLHGRGESFDEVEALRAALAASPLVREVQADETRTTVDGKGVEFRLRVVRRTAVGAPS